LPRSIEKLRVPWRSQPGVDVGQSIRFGLNCNHATRIFEDPYAFGLRENQRSFVILSVLNRWQKHVAIKKTDFPTAGKSLYIVLNPRLARKVR